MQTSISLSHLEDDSGSASLCSSRTASQEQAHGGRKAKHASIVCLFLEMFYLWFMHVYRLAVVCMNEAGLNIKGRHLWWRLQYSAVNVTPSMIFILLMKYLLEVKEWMVLGPWKTFKYMDIIKLSFLLPETMVTGNIRKTWWQKHFWSSTVKGEIICLLKACEMQKPSTIEPNPYSILNVIICVYCMFYVCEAWRGYSFHFYCATIDL